MAHFHIITTVPHSVLHLRATLIPTRPMSKVCGVFSSRVEPSFSVPRTGVLDYVTGALLDSPDQKLISFPKFKLF